MVRSKKKLTDDGRSFTIAETQSLMDDKREIEATIKHIEANPGTAGKERIDIGALKKQATHIDRMIHDGAPKTPRGAKKDEAQSRAEELKKTIMEGMPSKGEMDHPSKHPGALHKHINWSKRTDAAVREYKEIQRRLNPSDPTAVDIERLRRS